MIMVGSMPMFTVTEAVRSPRTAVTVGLPEYFTLPVTVNRLPVKLPASGSETVHWISLSCRWTVSVW